MQAIYYKPNVGIWLESEDSGRAYFFLLSSAPNTTTGSSQHQGAQCIAQELHAPASTTHLPLAIKLVPVFSLFPDLCLPDGNLSHPLSSTLFDSLFTQLLTSNAPMSSISALSICFVTKDNFLLLLLPMTPVQTKSKHSTRWDLPFQVTVAHCWASTYERLNTVDLVLFLPTAAIFNINTTPVIFQIPSSKHDMNNLNVFEHHLQFLLIWAKLCVSTVLYLYSILSTAN